MNKKGSAQTRRGKQVLCDNQTCFHLLFYAIPACGAVACYDFFGIPQNDRFVSIAKESSSGLFLIEQQKINP
jgi:hypothetical protein